MKALSTDIIPEVDLRYILANPWSISAMEWRLGDENSKESMFHYIQELLTLTEEGGYSKIWRDEKALPIAILGCYPVAKTKYTTFLVCSDLYEEHALKISFQMRKTLKVYAQYYPGCSIGIFSSSRHPHVFTWLRFLGFQYLPNRDDGNSRYFEYRSSSN
ncbi:hypothetical protein [Croceiramulus getboli]|nr:hypothetical protein P8624_09720 [Flavobacteriaceae bacterium YJPT1-3]